jgi:tRNA modification GTPase
MDELIMAVTKLAESFQVDTGDELIAINARHSQSLGNALTCLQAARQKITQGESSELVSSDLRVALEAFGEISGKIDNEQMLDRLFASFCIGK